MDEERARAILEDDIQEDGSLYCLGRYLSWTGSNLATLDADFEADELEAIAWWMRKDRK